MFVMCAPSVSNVRIEPLEPWAAVDDDRAEVGCGSASNMAASSDTSPNDDDDDDVDDDDVDDDSAADDAADDACAGSVARNRRAAPIMSARRD